MVILVILKHTCKCEIQYYRSNQFSYEIRGQGPALRVDGLHEVRCPSREDETPLAVSIRSTNYLSRNHCLCCSRLSLALSLSFPYMEFDVLLLVVRALPLAPLDPHFLDPARGKQSLMRFWV